MNRCAIILRPKRPYLSWVETIERMLSKEYGGTPSGADGDRTAYLIPPSEAWDSIDEVIERSYSNLFERELSEWYGDEALWPKPRTLKMFRGWFDVEVCTMIVDLVEAPLIEDEVPEPPSFWSRILRKIRGE